MDNLVVARLEVVPPLIERRLGKSRIKRNYFFEFSLISSTKTVLASQGLLI